MLEAFEDEVGDAAGCWDLGWFGGGAGLIGIGDGGGQVGGAVDAESRVPEEGVDDVVPEVLEVVDGPGGVEDAAVGGLVAELEREVFALADGVFDVELRVVDVEVDVAAVLRQRADAGVEDLRHFDVGVQIDIVV